MFYYGTVFPNLHCSCHLNRRQMSLEAGMAEMSPVPSQRCEKDFYDYITLESS